MKSIVCLPPLPEGHYWDLLLNDWAVYKIWGKSPLNSYSILWVNSSIGWSASGVDKKREIKVDSEQEAVNIIATWAWLD